MGHKCFISFKKEDQNYRNMLDAYFEKVDIINKSLDREIESDNADYIMQVIREQYLEDSTITIFLIGKHSSENDGFDVFRRRKNHFIERELQASLHMLFVNLVLIITQNLTMGVRGVRMNAIVFW